MAEIRAELTGPEEAELHCDGSPGVLVCRYSGVTGEWSPAEFRLHDGGTLTPDDLPLASIALNEASLEALEALS